MQELWTEKYRPNTVENYVFRDQSQKEQVQSWIDGKTIPHLLFSGAPGVGKSCLIDKVLIDWSSKGIKTALLAIDPSSPRTGGALLGDRVRITAIDNEQYKDLIYIRSIATRKSSEKILNFFSNTFLYSEIQAIAESFLLSNLICFSAFF